MPSAPKSVRSHCPIAYALDLFGDKWTLLIVRDLLLKGKRRYGEFLDSEEGIASNILADRLVKLEACGLVRRVPAIDGGKARAYVLTGKGMDLAPMLVEMILWSAKHDPATAASPSFVRKVRKDRGAVLHEIVEAAKAVPTVG